ncbi:hypothetical protein PFICI_03407 [Pestalotiopsis fici W106-1]|uniref:Uncharacterized protein n=1 Tax=Pestalotiopsis fici (strain W106-1 / CGMCC3.15140) TaxID=1229662 RepID=W3XIW9_PESFW|nr:uncharacterized protein PFICI_03407 [Pestalotiopsis fici W106-1]ETS85382.1 hypothetical protein PFICI_03407 [Pestalotiopsis fici W106-1]
MHDGRERTVRFRESDSSSRPSPPSRDSGLGSSTDQTYIRGRSDRFFTAQDHDTQRFNVGALQEALDSCREEKGKYKSKAHDLDAQLNACKSTLREKELENRSLREENSTLRHQRDTFESEVHDLRRRLAPSEPDYMMSGGSGESSNGLGRTRSKRQDGQDQKNRLRERINMVNEPAPSNRDSIRGRRLSMSHTTAPYPRDTVDSRPSRGPPLTTRGFQHIDATNNNYTTSAPVGSPTTFRTESLSSPRSTTSTLNTFMTGGDYVPEPLPPKPKVDSKSSSSRKTRH